MHIFDIFYSPETILIINSSIIFINIIWINKMGKDNYYNIQNCFSFVIFILANTTIFSQFFSPSHYVIFNTMYNVSYIEFIITYIIFILSFIFFIFAKENKISFTNYEFIIIILLIISSGFLIISCSDFILFFLCLELFSMLSFTLILKRRSSANAEGSFKYLIFASIASIILLLALFTIFFSSGLTNIYLISITKIFYNYSVNILFIIILVSFMIKYGIFPFHSWVPDVYQASPNPLFIFFTTFSKIFIVIPFVKIISNISIDNFLLFFVISISFFGVLFSTIIGFQQLTFRRLFAYSSISNAGLIFLLFVNINKSTISVIVNFTIIYIIISISILSLIIFYKKKENESEVIFIPEFQNSPEKTLSISSILAINIFFLSGIPPFGLFFPKVWVFKDFLFYQPSFTIIIIGMYFFTLLNIFYYCRIIQYVINFISFNKPIIENIYFTNITTTNWYISIIITFTVIFMPFYFNKNYTEIISNLF